MIDSCEALEKACHEVFHHDEVADCSKAIERAMLELEQALQQQIGTKRQKHNDRALTMLGR